MDEDGKAHRGQPRVREGLDKLVQAYADGNIPEAAITYTEEESRISFQDGKLLFMRQWPYAYDLAETEGSSKVKGKFDVAPLLGANGVGASSLGGHNNAISAYSDNKATAIDFVNWILEEEQQRLYVDQGRQRAGARVALHRPGAGEAVRLPPGAAGVDQDRGARVRSRRSTRR